MIYKRKIYKSLRTQSVSVLFPISRILLASLIQDTLRIMTMFIVDVLGSHLQTFIERHVIRLYCQLVYTMRVV